MAEKNGDGFVRMYVMVREDRTQVIKTRLKEGYKICFPENELDGNLMSIGRSASSIYKNYTTCVGMIVNQ